MSNTINGNGNSHLSQPPMPSPPKHKPPHVSAPPPHVQAPPPGKSNLPNLPTPHHIHWTGSNGNPDNQQYGTNGPDIIHGTPGSDDLYNLGGNDVVRSHNGNDRIYAGTGNDYVNGNRGNDTVYGQEGHDVLRGGKNNDCIYGGRANDVIHGDRGDDLIRAGKDNDHVYGGTGNDVLYGDKGSDYIDGGVGVDTAVFTRPLSEYYIERTPQGEIFIINNHTRDTDRLVNVECLRFGCGATIETENIPLNNDAHMPGGKNPDGGNYSLR